MNPSYKIDTVHERSQGAYNFAQYYDNLCALQDTVPVHSVKTNLDKHSLDINADKIRLNDWTPLLKAIQINKSLKKIGIFSFYNDNLRTSKEQDPSTVRTPLTPSSGKNKIPAVHSKDLTYQLCKVIKDCLNVSDNLEVLQLEGLPFRSRDIVLISKGVRKSYRLKELSLESSHIGESLQLLCDGIKNASTINSLNLSSCSLVDGAVEAISRVVRHQAVMRHSEAWKSSLRYRSPDLDCMPGLRRITLNNNPLLGDRAAEAIAEALKDDLWLKAIDLQRCGISDRGAELLLESLRLNSTLVVLDIRDNQLISKSLQDRIIQQLVINSDDKHSQYGWLALNESEEKRRKFETPRRIKPARSLSTPGNSLAITLHRNKKTQRTSKSSPTNTPHHRSKSIPHHLSNTPRSQSRSTPQSVPKQRGLPWRTAERATVHKFMDGPEPSPEMKTKKSPPRPTRTSEVETQIHIHKEQERDNMAETIAAIDQEALVIIKELQAENISLKRRLTDENVARSAAEDRALELARDNRRLQSDIRQLSGSRPTPAADEELLSQVETAFQKFNMFLDLVKNTGMGHLIKEAGLSHYADTSSPVPYSERIEERSIIQPVSFSEYLIDQKARSGTDIIPHTDMPESQKTSYTDHMTGSKTLTRVAADQQTQPKQDYDDQPTDEQTAAGDFSKSITIKTVELKDISELETPKLTPRLSPRDKNADTSDNPATSGTLGTPIIAPDVRQSVNTEATTANYPDSFNAESEVESLPGRLGTPVHSRSPSERSVTPMKSITPSPSLSEEKSDGGLNIKSLSQLGSESGPDQVMTSQEYTADFSD